MLTGMYTMASRKALGTVAQASLTVWRLACSDAINFGENMRNFTAHVTVLLLLGFFTPVYAQTQSNTGKTSDTKTDSQGKTAQPQVLNDEQVNAIKRRCNFDPAETDPKKVNKAVA